MNRIVLSLAFCLCFPCVSAGESAVSAIDTLQAIAGTHEIQVEPLTIKEGNSGLPKNIGWNYTIDDLYVRGGRQFEFRGHKYSVKLVFLRGDYDTYIRNYKPIVGVSLSDVTNPDRFTIWSLFKISDLKNDWQLITTSSGALKISYVNDSLSVDRYLVEGADANVAVFTYKDLIAAWQEGASPPMGSFILNYGSDPEYFVLQRYLEGEVFVSGYVVSEYGVLYPNSGLPLDFVELFRGDSPVQFKPIAYSIPLCMSFKYLGNQGHNYTWEAKNLTPEDFEDALADEARSHERHSENEAFLEGLGKSESKGVSR